MALLRKSADAQHRQVTSGSLSSLPPPLAGTGAVAPPPEQCWNAGPIFGWVQGPGHAPVPAKWGTLSIAARLLQGRETNPEGGRIVDSFNASICTKALPPIEAMRSSALTPTNGESDDPQDEKDGCNYPQEMHCGAPTCFRCARI